MQDEGDKSFICTYPVCKSKRTLKDMQNVNALSLCQCFHIAHSHLLTSLIPKLTTIPLEGTFLSSPLLATYLPNIYLLVSSHLLLRLPSCLFSKVPPPLQNSVCFIISPHASYICGSILVVSYLNCIYNTFVLHCLKFSPMHTCNECCANSSKFMLLFFDTKSKYANYIC